MPELGWRDEYRALLLGRLAIHRRVDRATIGEICQVSSSTLSRWMTGNIDPRKSQRDDLARALRVDSDWLDYWLDWKPEPGNGITPVQAAEAVVIPEDIGARTPGPTHSSPGFADTGATRRSAG